MQLYRAIALIAVVMIFLLSAGYAAGEHDEPDQASSLSARASGS